MASDCIHITGIRAYGYTGFLPEEQSLGQWFEVNLSLWMDLSTAGQSDRLDDTCDYSKLVPAIQTLIRTQRFLLIERLAEAIADRVLQSGGVEQTKVRLTKLVPPIPDFSGSVTIEILRSQAFKGS